MARCPSCKCTFRTLEDEEGMHACPRCGYGDEPDPPACSWCSEEFNEDDRDDYAPYCGQSCALEADRDNEENHV